MKLLRAVVVVAILSVAMAQDIGEESAFPSLLNLLPGPQFFSQPSMLGDDSRQPSFFSFRNFFSLNNDDDQGLEDMPQMSIRVRIQEQEDDSPLSNIMSMFSRLTNIMDSLDEKESVLNENQPEPKRRVCPFMRACGEDIEAFCKEEAQSGVRGRVSACLSEKKDLVSGKCSELLQKHMKEHREEEEKPEQQVPEPDQDHPCSQALDECKLNNDNMVSIMMCLHKKRETLSTACTEALETKPGFMCAPDIEKFCPKARGHALERCLTTHDVSAQCKSVIPKQPAPAPITHDVPKPVIAGHAPASTPRVTAKAPSQPADHGFNMKIAGAIGAGVALTVIAVLVIVIRKRRRRRARQEEYHTIQLVNPSQQAVDISPEFVPEPSEEL